MLQVHHLNAPNDPERSERFERLERSERLRRRRIIAAGRLVLAAGDTGAFPRCRVLAAAIHARDEPARGVADTACHTRVIPVSVVAVSTRHRAGVAVCGTTVTAADARNLTEGQVRISAA